MISIFALLAPRGGGGGGGGGSSEGNVEANGHGSNDSLNIKGNTPSVDRYPNGDTQSVSYFNSENKITKYVDKYENGQIRSFFIYQYSNSHEIDRQIRYFENGKMQMQINKLDNEFDGEQMNYYENGNVKSKRKFSKGKEIESKSYDENGKSMPVGNK